MSTASAEAINWAVVLVGTAFGGASMWIGWRTWQGRFPGVFGPQPPYQSYFGAAHAAVPAGAGFAGIGLGELVRGVLGEPRDGGVYLAFSIIAFALLVVGTVYVLCYYWLGVPPRLRPPYQRTQRAPGSGRPSRFARLRHHR